MSKSTIPNPARTPAQARTNTAGKIPQYIDLLNKQLDEGIRLFSVPAGAAALLAAAMREQGWSAVVSDGKPGEKTIVFSCADDMDPTEAD